MGLYEQWNPLLFAVHPLHTESVELLEKAVNQAFSAAKLNIGTYGSGKPIQWTLSHDSVEKYQKQTAEQLEKARKKFSETVASDSSVIKYYTGNRGWLEEQICLLSRLQKKSWSYHFYIPKINEAIVSRLIDAYVGHDLARDKQHVITDVFDSNPHNYMSAMLKVDSERVAARIVDNLSYSRPQTQSIWISAKKKNTKALIDQEDLTIELRVSPLQRFMNIAQSTAHIGYALMEKEFNNKKTFLDIWHSVVPDLISPDLLRNERLPSQQ